MGRSEDDSPTTHVEIPPVARWFKRSDLQSWIILLTLSESNIHNIHKEAMVEGNTQWAVEPAWLGGNHMWIPTAWVPACFLSQTPFLEATLLSKWSCDIALSASRENQINVCVCNQWMEKVDTLKIFSPFLCCVMSICVAPSVSPY